MCVCVQGGVGEGVGGGWGGLYWLFLITETVGEGRSASRGMALSAVML